MIGCQEESLCQTKAIESTVPDVRNLNCVIFFVTLTCRLSKFVQLWKLICETLPSKNVQCIFNYERFDKTRARWWPPSLSAANIPHGIYFRFSLSLPHPRKFAHPFQKSHKYASEMQWMPTFSAPAIYVLCVNNYKGGNQACLHRN